MLLNYKIYIDFADKPFVESFNLLLNEINHIISKQYLIFKQDYLTF